LAAIAVAKAFSTLGGHNFGHSLKAHNIFHTYPQMAYFLLLLAAVFHSWFLLGGFSVDDKRLTAS
jgi:hypothetical protein